MGFITTKLKADNRFFLVQADRGYDGKDFRDAHPPLEQGKTYYGLLLDGSYVDQNHYVAFRNADPAEFKSEALEEMPGNFRLIKYHASESWNA